MKLYSKKAEGGDYSGFRFILLSDRYLMVAFDQVQLAEDGGAMEVVGQVQHVGQGVPVRGGELVQVSVVAAWAPAPTWFLYHVEGQ